MSFQKNYERSRKEANGEERVVIHPRIKAITRDRLNLIVLAYNEDREENSDALDQGRAIDDAVEDLWRRHPELDVYVERLQRVLQR